MHLFWPYHQGRGFEMTQSRLALPAAWPTHLGSALVRTGSNDFKLEVRMATLARGSNWRYDQ